MTDTVTTPKHDCEEQDLEYRAHYGAPGHGQAWECRVCERPWSKLGTSFHPAEDGAHILAPENVI